MAVAEKAKDFKSALRRLIKELKVYKAFIIVALTLAIFSAILSILAPNKLSKLTDEISKGLVINQNNIQKISNAILNNLSEDNLKDIIENKIITSESISKEDKLLFNSLIQNISNVLSEEEKIKLLTKIPDSIKQIIFEDIKIDGITLTYKEQLDFIKEMSTTNKENFDVNELYKKVENLPTNIKTVIKPVMNIESIKTIALILAIIYACSSIFSYIQSVCMTDVANKFAKSLRSKISNKINMLPLRYYDKNTTGDILSRVTNDVDTIAQSMNQSLATLVSNITLFLGTIIMMFYTNWILAITAILASLIGFLCMTLILKKSQKYFVQRQEHLGALNGHIEEIYSGLNVVKVYNGKNDADKKFDEYNKKVCESNKKSQFLSGLMHPLMHFIGNFGYVAVCIVGALLTMNDIISFGVIVAFITYVRLFTNPLSQIAQAMTSIQSTAAASERVFEFTDEVELTSQEKITKILEKNKVKGKIEFENVVFQYDNNNKPTINNFSAVAMPGQKVAIVGPTGAGKTTMVNLLMKFYEINSGDIKIDGVSTKDLTRENIHDLFTMVLQDTWLFDGTVKENIIYNRENVSDEKVVEVCKEVGLHHFIKTLPHGYDSILSENDSVSAGQRQLLTIARGMIHDAPFLILDEATSNVDTRTEELVQNAMDKLTKGKTSFIIAHRLSTIKNSDLILVMKNGNIIEQGNHEQLMIKNGEYAKLYNSQFEL